MTSSKETSSIREVWASNFEKEVKAISDLIDKFPYISMDTEFPGIIHSVSSKIKENTYKSIKANVDELKLIQFGITLSDEKGNLPPEISTWQFNMKFDLKNDKYSSDSINLLINSGIYFEKLEELGISPLDFGNIITTSGLVMNDEIKWIAFHGSYDFAYLVKLLTNQPLPETEQGFFDLLNIFFPNFYDIRHFIKGLEGFSKSLQKLALELDVARIGIQHQAGSDSFVTSRVYHKLVSTYISSEALKDEENILFGLGNFYEDEIATIFDSCNMIPNSEILLSANSNSTASNVNVGTTIRDGSNLGTNNVGNNRLNVVSLVGGSNFGATLGNIGSTTGSNLASLGSFSSSHTGHVNPLNQVASNNSSNSGKLNPQFEVSPYYLGYNYNNFGTAYYRNGYLNYNYAQINPAYGYQVSDYITPTNIGNINNLNYVPLTMGNIATNTIAAPMNEELKKRNFS